MPPQQQEGHRRWPYVVVGLGLFVLSMFFFWLQGDLSTESSSVPDGTERISYALPGENVSMQYAVVGPNDQPPQLQQVALRKSAKFRYSRVSAFKFRVKNIGNARGTLVVKRKSRLMNDKHRHYKNVFHRPRSYSVSVGVGQTVVVTFPRISRADEPELARQCTVLSDDIMVQDGGCSPGFK